MAFRTLTSVSSDCTSLSPSASFLDHKPSGVLSNFSKHSVNFRYNFGCCKRSVFCTALLEDVETWRSTVQDYGRLVLFPSVMVVPLLVVNFRASQVRVDPVSIRVGHFMAQIRRFQNRGLGTLFSALILANAFYSDIAPPNAVDTFENVPQELDLSGGDKPRRIQRPKSKKAEGCTQKCLGTCIRGGAGSPGEGPFNIRRPLVVFKEGFRSRQYCLIECSEICNIIGDGDDGP